jgi:hypothetical protein
MDINKKKSFKELRQERHKKDRKGFFILSILGGLILLCVVGFGCYEVYDHFFGMDKPSVSAENNSLTQVAPSDKDVVHKNISGPNAVAEKKETDSAGSHNYSILIKKGEYKLYLLDNGKILDSWKVALGKNPGQKQVSGDLKTPDGSFLVDEIDDASSWSHDFGDGKGVIANAYGPWFISLNTDALSGGKWGGIGIHGTHDLSSIGTRASEGCIRLNNENLIKLVKYIKVGSKVTIEE